MLTLKKSPAFENGGPIPPQFTCDGDNISPELVISGVPEGAKSLALLVEDPDIPQFAKEKFGIDVFDHWTLFNIPFETARIASGGMVGVSGVTSQGKERYTGPCPLPHHEPAKHRYFFRLYVLDTKLPLAAGATKADVLAAMEGHILATAELIGTYSRTA